MKGIGKYRKLTKGWEKYIFDTILPRVLSEFPDTKKLTQKRMAQILVEENWIDEVQRYTWRSAIASGLEIEFSDFKQQLLEYETYDGKVVNAWYNSQVRQVSRKLTKRIKKHVKTLNQRLTILEDTNELKTVSKLFATIDNPTKEQNRVLRQLESDWDLLDEATRAKRLSVLKDIVSEDMKGNQYRDIVTESVDKVPNYQGKRLSQDQLQHANNQLLEQQASEFNPLKEPELELVGFWELSPGHNTHYYPGGEDICEIHARHDDGYGRGSHVGDIPIPVRDSHMNCSCSLTLKVIEKSERNS